MRTRELEPVAPAAAPAESRDTERAPTKKRPAWDARKKRLDGTGAEEFFREGEEGLVKPNRDFRKGHAALHEVIQTARRLGKLKRLLESQ
jgi:hypothetical protein